MTPPADLITPDRPRSISDGEAVASACVIPGHHTCWSSAFATDGNPCEVGAKGLLEAIA
jgi:hypothetical protein